MPRLFTQSNLTDTSGRKHTQYKKYLIGKKGWDLTWDVQEDTTSPETLSTSLGIVESKVFEVWSYPEHRDNQLAFICENAQTAAQRDSIIKELQEKLFVQTSANDDLKSDVEKTSEKRNLAEKQNEELRKENLMQQSKIRELEEQIKITTVASPKRKIQCMTPEIERSIDDIFTQGANFQRR